MQQKPDVTPRTRDGIPAEIVAVAPIARTRGLNANSPHLRMDPRVLSRIHDVVAVLQTDYSDVLREQIVDMGRIYADLKAGDRTAAGKLYAIAHEIRGIAGTFARPLAGKIADRICAHLDEETNGEGCDLTGLYEHIDTLTQIARLTPEPDGIVAKVVLKRLNEDAPLPPVAAVNRA